MQGVNEFVIQSFVLVALSCGAIASASAADADQDAGRQLVPSMSYDGDLGNVANGGRDAGQTTYTGLLHLRLRWVVPTNSDWRGTSAFVDVRNIHGGHLTDVVGDAQDISNVDGPDGTAIHELWLQHNFRWSGVSLLGGIYDLSSEFDRVRAAGLFLNSSFGVTPEFAESGETGPSIFPRTAAALRFSVKPWTGVLLRAALVNGASFERPDGSHALFKHDDGALEVIEWAMLRRPEAKGDEPLAPRSFGRFSPLPTYEDKIAVGAWHYSRKFPEAGSPSDDTSTARHSSEGCYVIGEWRLFGRGADAKKQVSGFSQAGFASPSTNRFGGYFGGGVVATGWLFGKESDQVGIAFASAQESSTYRRNLAMTGVHPTKSETTWELSYLAQLQKWLTVEPDVQVVNHPSADAALHNALVVQLRTEVTF